MANTYKNILIVPNIGAATGTDPYISFRGGNATVNTEITLKVYPDSNGTLSFEGNTGQLFSITNDLTGSIFSVNDISGIPSIDVNANGEVRLAQFDGNVLIGTANSDGSSLLSVSGPANVASLRIRTYGEVINASAIWTGPIIPAGKANVSVYANSGSTVTASGLNFVNSSSVTVSVTSGSSGNANVAFTVTGGSGAQGAQGAPGAQGAVGAQGSVGAQGAQGIQGAVGAQGVVGAQGAQGRQGVQGSVGAQGAAGAQGAVGAQGSQGVQGATGGSTTTSIVTANTQTAIKDNRYILSNSTFTTVTLPAAPTLGDTIYLVIANGLANNVIARNGTNIMGLAEDMTVDIANSSFGLVYTNASLGWRII